MIENILNELFSCRTSKRRKDINDLSSIYRLLGKPCSGVKVVHIAGTNGKGSTAAFIENILIAGGFNVGKFTSPHILKYNERIVFNKEMIKDEEIAYHYKTVKETVERHNRGLSDEEGIYLNFFEITTFTALLFFDGHKPDFIIMETGIGGRLDATNVVQSDVALITNISLDHTDILGSSLNEIAYEKAGIIKDGQLCIYSDSLPELKEEIEKRTLKHINIAEKYRCDLETELDKIKYNTIVSFKGKKFVIPLFGKFQAYNFLLAYETAKIYNIDDDIIQEGLDSTYWPGRFEFFSSRPTVIMDAAHNEDSIRKLAENLAELYNSNEVIIITSLLSTKNLKKIFTELSLISSKIYITSLKDVVYGLSAAEIKERLTLLNITVENIIFEDDIMTAYDEAIDILKNDRTKGNTGYKAIVICGSFYEISKFKRLHSERERKDDFTKS